MFWIDPQGSNFYFLLYGRAFDFEASNLLFCVAGKGCNFLIAVVTGSGRGDLIRATLSGGFWSLWIGRVLVVLLDLLRPKQQFAGN
jgi:hypothetical protein